TETAGKSSTNADDGDDLAKLQAEYKNNIRKRFLDTAQNHIKAKRFDEALNYYNKILEDFPNDADARLGIQTVNEEKLKLHVEQKAIDAVIAEKKIKEAEEIRKSELALLIKQGKSALALKEFTQAENFFKIALDKAPGDEDATR